jgi:hypothetical protein
LIGDVVFELLFTVAAALAPVTVASDALAIVAVPASASVINGRRLVMAPPQ